MRKSHGKTNVVVPTKYLIKYGTITILVEFLSRSFIEVTRILFKLTKYLVTSAINLITAIRMKLIRQKFERLATLSASTFITC